ncbi:MAG: TrmB family transcriptional regulator [Gemmatimonadales bacterium]
MVDLIPFGFTPTESRVYSAMMDLGPTTAYRLAKELNLARANTYQALDGLASKGACVVIAETPKRFRPVAPRALLTLLTKQQATRLDRLESELLALGKKGEEKTVRFSGRRAFEAVVLRNAVHADSVSCIASSHVLHALTPIWRKRAADGKRTRLWVVGEVDGELAIETEGSLPAESVMDLFGSPVALLLTADHAILAREMSDGNLDGYWTSDSLLAGSARAAVTLLSAT